MYDWIQFNHLFINVHITVNNFTHNTIKMFFFKHSYITVIIAVIAIWAMPVISAVNMDVVRGMVQFY